MLLRCFAAKSGLNGGLQTTAFLNQTTMMIDIMSNKDGAPRFLENTEIKKSDNDLEFGLVLVSR